MTETQVWSLCGICEDEWIVFTFAPAGPAGPNGPGWPLEPLSPRIPYWMKKQPI